MYLLSRQILFRDWRSRLENELVYYECDKALIGKASQDENRIAVSVIRNRIDDEHLRTVSQDRLQHLPILYIESDVLQNVNLDNLIFP